LVRGSRSSCTYSWLHIPIVPLAGCAPVISECSATLAQPPVMTTSTGCRLTVKVGSGSHGLRRSVGTSSRRHPRIHREAVSCHRGYRKAKTFFHASSGRGEQVATVNTLLTVGLSPPTAYPPSPSHVARTNRMRFGIEGRTPVRGLFDAHAASLSACSCLKASKTLCISCLDISLREFFPVTAR